MGRLIHKGQFSSNWPAVLGFTKEEITLRLEDLAKDGSDISESFATVLYENNQKAAQLLQQHLANNLQFLNQKIDSLEK